MNKIRAVTFGLIVSLLTVLAFGNPPVAEGSYARVKLNPSIFSASWLGTNTNLLQISLVDNAGDNYVFTATGQTILNVPENRELISVLLSYTIDDNYASSNAEADSRARVILVLTDPSAVDQSDNIFTSANGTVLFSAHLITYYLVRRVHALENILMTPGTWELNAEYEILAIPP